MAQPPAPRIRPALHERYLSRLRQHRGVALLIAAGTLVIALASFTDAARKLVALVQAPAPGQAREELVRLAVPFTPAAYLEAAAHGDLVVLKLFIAAAMPVDELVPRAPSTALAAAAGANRSAAVDLLLDAGADPSLGAGRWGSPLHEAAASGHEAIVRRLLREKPSGAAVDESFVSAARYGHPAVMRLLQAQGADVARLRQSALFAAASHVSPDPAALAEAIILLLQAGADPRAAEPETGLTPLHHAAYEGHVASAIALLDQGADPNVRDAEGCTPLWWAAGVGRSEMVAILMARGADAGAASDDGTTVLQRAQGNRDDALVQRLLARGAR